MTSYRWAAGTLTVTALTSTYDVEGFPIQTDQLFPWYPPHGDSVDLYDVAVEVVDALDGTSAAFGDGSFRWILGPLTPKMVDYIITNRFNGGAWSWPATVMTRDASSDTNQWRVVNCIAKRRLFRASSEMMGVGVGNWVIDFIKARAAAT